VQGIGRLFRCLCNPAYDVDDDFEPRKWVLKKQTPIDVFKCSWLFSQVYDSEPCESISFIAILYLKDTHVDATSALVSTMTFQISRFPFSLPRTVALLFPPFFEIDSAGLCCAYVICCYRCCRKKKGKEQDYVKIHFLILKWYGKFRYVNFYLILLLAHHILYLQTLCNFISTVSQSLLSFPETEDSALLSYSSFLVEN